MCAITKLNKKGQLFHRSKVGTIGMRGEMGIGKGVRAVIPKGAVYWEGESLGGGGESFPLEM